MSKHFAHNDGSPQPVKTSASGGVGIRTLGQLTGQTAHDLNNMLAVTLSSIEIASRLDDIAKSREFLATAVKMINLLREFTDNMSRASRACESPVVVDLHRAIARLVGELEGELGTSIKMALRLDADRSRVRCDEQFLCEALRNIAMNAVRALPNGGLLSMVTRNAPHPGGMAAGAASDFIALTVTDNGIGMSEEMCRKAFDLFVSDGGANLGLGLAQVRDMARRAGGFATIESTPGVGTTVTVGLPVVDEGER